MSRFERQMKVLRSLLQAHDAALQSVAAVSNAMHAVVEDALAPDSSASPSKFPTSPPPEPPSGPTVLQDVPLRTSRPGPNRHTTRAMPRVSSSTFEDFIMNAWRQADTDEKKKRVRKMVDEGAAKGVLDSASIDRLAKLTT